MWVSLSRSSMISTFIALSRKLLPILMASKSTLANCLLIKSNSFLTFPKWFRLHHFNFFPHFPILHPTLVSKSRQSWDDQTTSIVSEQPLLDSHISSKWKRFRKSRKTKLELISYSMLFHKKLQICAYPALQLAYLDSVNTKCVQCCCTHFVFYSVSLLMLYTFWLSTM